MNERHRQLVALAAAVELIYRAVLADPESIRRRLDAERERLAGEIAKINQRKY